MPIAIDKINNFLKKNNCKDGYVAIDTRFGWEYNVFYYDTEPVLHTDPNVYTITDGCKYLFCLTEEEFNEINKQRVFTVTDYKLNITPKKSTIDKINDLLKYYYIKTGYLAVDIRDDEYTVRWYSKKPTFNPSTNKYTPAGLHMYLTKLTAEEFKELYCRRMFKVIDSNAFAISDGTQEDVFNLFLMQLDASDKKSFNGYLFVDNVFMDINDKKYHKVYLVCEERVIYLTFISDADLKALGDNLFVVKDGKFITPGLTVDFSQATETTLFQLAKNTFASEQLFKVIRNPFTDTPIVYGIFTEENINAMLAMLNYKAYSPLTIIQLVDCRLIVNQYFDVYFQILPI